MQALAFWSHFLPFGARTSPALVSPLVKWQSATRKQEVPVISDVLEESWLPLTQSVTWGWSVSRDPGALPSSLRSESHLGCQAEWCQVLSYSPPCLVFPSPKKMIPPLPPQPLTLGKPKMSHRTSPLETGDSDFLLPKEAERDFLACHMVPGGLLSWPGSAVHPLPCDKLHFSCLSLLHQLSGLSCLTLPYTMLLWREREKNQTTK